MENPDASGHRRPSLSLLETFEIEVILNWRFQDRDLLVIAFDSTPTVRSSGFVDTGTAVNLDQAILGSGVMRIAFFHAAAFLADTIGPENVILWIEEQMSCQNIAARGFAAGLEQYIRLPNGAFIASDEQMTSVIQALIAAVHLDSGARSFDPALRVILELGFFDSFRPPHHYFGGDSFCNPS